MLDWLIAVPSTAYSNADDGNNSAMLEPPETPAPLFAVRAFKTALFGTPARADSLEKSNGQEVVDDEQNLEHYKAIAGEQQNESAQIRSPVKQSAKDEAPVSPAKGILLTPGANKSQRKTVSFGTSRSLRQSILRSTVNASSGLGPNERSRVKTSHRVSSNQDGEPAANPISASVSSNHGLNSLDLNTVAYSNMQAPEGQVGVLPGVGNIRGDIEGDKDLTMDLQEPKSRSGQHWKRQYSHYHTKSDHEMRRLLTYTQNAKSFATKRDAEAIDLEGKLKAALATVADMEAKVSNLASQLAQSGKNLMNPDDPADLVTQLALQTTEVLRYKRKVEELEDLTRKRDTHGQGTSFEHASTQNAGSLHSIELLGSASSSLSPYAQCAIANADFFQKENASLKKTILRVKDEMVQYEIRHKARREEWKRSADRSKARQTHLKERLKQQEASHTHAVTELKAAHAIEIRDLQQQLCDLQASRARDPQATLNSCASKKATELRTDRIISIEPQTDKVGQQPSYCGHSKTWTELRSPHKEDSRHSQDINTKTSSSLQMETLRRPGHLKAVSEGFKSPSKPIPHHPEHSQILDQPHSSPHTHYKPGHETSPSLSSSQRPLVYEKNNGDSPKPREGDGLVTGNRTALPPDRLAAAKMRVERRLASKQQPSAAGKENVMPIRALDD